MTNRALLLLICVIVVGCQGTGPPVNEVKWYRYSLERHAVAALPTSPTGRPDRIVIGFSENPVSPGYVPTSKLGPYATYHYSATVFTTVKHPIAAMLGFLTQKSGYLISRYWQEDCTAEERKGRLQYLNSAMTIFPGHWGRGWHFETHPHIGGIQLSLDLKNATVMYRVYYGLEVAFMEREDRGEWVIISTEHSFVE